MDTISFKLLLKQIYIQEIWVVLSEQDITMASSKILFVSIVGWLNNQIYNEMCAQFDCG